VRGVVERHRAFDDLLAERLADQRYADMAPRDRRFARLIAATALRRFGGLDAVVSSYLDRPLPADRGSLSFILVTAAAQMLYLGTPAYAAVSAAVELVRADRHARRFDKLANAVLRRISEDGAGRAAALDRIVLDIPAWLLSRWQETFGDAVARRVAEASLSQAALDIRLRGEVADWPQRLDGRLLSTGSIRIAGSGRVDDLPGFDEGAWWVQDAAASLPVTLFGDVAGLSILDICAAPGGKTLQLASAGANVTALDISAERLQRVRSNLERLGLDAEIVPADATRWRKADGVRFDAVLLDAPCLASGTIRRHPDILHLKKSEDLVHLAAVQGQLLLNAAALVRPGGMLIYCTCSLEPEECGNQIETFLAGNADFMRVPITPPELNGHAEWIDDNGDLRTLPFHSPGNAGDLVGMDGFYACRLRRQPPNASNL